MLQQTCCQSITQWWHGVRVQIGNYGYKVTKLIIKLLVVWPEWTLVGLLSVLNRTKDCFKMNTEFRPATGMNDSLLLICELDWGNNKILHESQPFWPITIYFLINQRRYTMPKWISMLDILMRISLILLVLTKQVRQITPWVMERQ